MSKPLFDYFYFTRSERTGTYILCALIILSILTPTIHRYWFSNNNSPRFIQADALALAPTNHFNDKTPDAIPQETSLFFFDPNTASKTDFLRLGLSPKVSQTMLNFRSKGGQFFEASDLKKIYGLSEESYLRLAPYVRIVSRASEESYAEKRVMTVSTDKPALEESRKTPLTISPFDPNTIQGEQLLSMGIPDKIVNTLLNFRDKGGQFYQKEDVAKIYGLTPLLYDSLAPFIQIAAAPPKKRKIIQSIDINQAATEDWDQLPGIGPYYAQRILERRDALGGFHSIEQVAETYGLPDSTFQLIRPYLTTSSILQTININKANKEELKAHPYLTYKHAQAIITYREQHGNYTSLQTLSRLPAISPQVLEKIRPYLRLE